VLTSIRVFLHVWLHVCLQERLELLEHENDLLVRQQNELEGELQRISGQLAERDQQVRLNVFLQQQH
jgi:hypothetical protein